jgi:hypothetical protein
LLLGDVTAAGCPAQCLRRLSKAPHEGAPHAFRIAEPDGGCDHFNRLDAALNAAFRCFRTQSLDGIGRGFAGRFMEGSRELSRAEARYRREPLNRQILGQVGLREDKGSLDAIGQRVQRQHLGIFRLATTPTERHNETPRNRTRHVDPIITLNQCKCQIYPRGNAGRDQTGPSCT